MIIQPFVTNYAFVYVDLPYEWGMKDYAFFIEIWAALSPLGNILGLLHCVALWIVVLLTEA